MSEGVGDHTAEDPAKLREAAAEWRKVAEYWRQEAEKVAGAGMISFVSNPMSALGVQGDATCRSMAQTMYDKAEQADAIADDLEANADRYEQNNADAGQLFV